MPAVVELRGKRILLTGASGGIGAATAAALRNAGAEVLGLDLSPADGDVGVDVRDGDSVTAAVEEALDRLGGLDVLVNNAGIGTLQDAGAPPSEDAVATLDVNLLGPWRVTGAAMPALLATHGRVVNVASGLAFANVPYAGAYCASKRGLAAYSDVLRLEYGDRLTVTTVYPGYIRTAIHDGPESKGVSLEHLVREEPLEGAVQTLLRACGGRPRRDLATTRGGTVELAVARHAPSLVDALIMRRVRRAVAEGKVSPSPFGDGAESTAHTAATAGLR